MEKEFDEWNIVKKQLHSKPDDRTRFHDREIWWCSLGVNLGTEQDGKNDHFVRPVLILKRFNKDLALVAPLTRTRKDNRFYHVLTVGAVKDSRIVLSQLRTLSSKRFRARMARVPEREFTTIQKKIIDLNFGSRECKNPSGEGL